MSEYTGSAVIHFDTFAVADNAQDAENDMKAALQDDFPDATQIIIENIEKV